MQLSSLPLLLTVAATHHANAQVHVADLAFELCETLLDLDQRAGICHGRAALVHLGFDSFKLFGDGRHFAGQLVDRNRRRLVSAVENARG